MGLEPAGPIGVAGDMRAESRPAALRIPSEGIVLPGPQGHLGP